MRSTIKRAMAVGFAAVVTAGTVAAWAAWTADGNGNAYAEAGTAQELVTSAAQTTATLYPNVTGDSTIRITNPNPYAVEVNSLKWTPSDGVQATPLAGSVCGNTGVYFGDFSNGPVGSNGLLSGLSLRVGAGDTTTFTLPDSVRMINNSENGCQGATFSIKVAIAGVSTD